MAGLMWGFRNLLQKSWGIFEKKETIFWVSFWVFYNFCLVACPFCTYLYKILVQGLKLILWPPYFIKKFILTDRSRVNDPPILAQKQQEMAFFDKTDFWGLKYPLEVRLQHETCIKICRTHVPAILNHENSTRSAGGAKNSQNWIFLKVHWPVGSQSLLGSKWQ